MNDLKIFLAGLGNRLSTYIPCCPSENLIPPPTLADEAAQRIAGSAVIKELFLRNTDAIMQAKDRGAFINRKGVLVFVQDLTPISDKEKGKGIELIRQVLRQAWGRVVEAQYAIGIKNQGPMLLEEAIHRVDLLQDKLRQIMPIETAQQVLAEEKWAKILANNYKATANELVEKINRIQPSHSPIEDQKIQRIKYKLMARDQVLWEYRENKKAEYDFIPFTKESGGVNFSGTQTVFKGSEKCVISKKGAEEGNWENPDLAWLNELIGNAFDQICGCRFGTAASTIALDAKKELNTLHSFKISDDFWHQAFNTNIDLKSSHQFVLFQILLKTQDSHKKNILCRQENGKYIPIPIDLGRQLSPSPHRSAASLLRFTEFIRWSTLNKKFDQETKGFVNKLDPDKVVDTLRALFINHPSLDASQVVILEKKLLHLRANILMVKEAIKEDLTPRQLIALSIFRLSHHNLSELELLMNDETLTKHRDYEIRKYLFKNCYCAFLSAWNKARAEGFFDEETFIEKIRHAILNIKKVNVSKRYFYKEALIKYYQLRL